MKTNTTLQRFALLRPTDKRLALPKEIRLLSVVYKSKEQDCSPTLYPNKSAQDPANWDFDWFASYE